MVARTVPPLSRTPTVPSFIPPEHTILDNGLNVYMYNSGLQDVVRLDLVFHGGKRLEAENGAAFFCLNMLLEGTNLTSGESISEIFDTQGAFYEALPGLDNNTISIYCPSAKLATLIPLVAEIIQIPAFPEDKLEKLKNQQVQQLAISEQKTSYWANRLFRETFFGKSHPYGQFMSLDSIQNISGDSLHNYFSMYINDISFDIIISGKFEKKYALAHINKHLGNFAAKKGNTENNYPVERALESSIIKKLPKRDQASICLGKVCLSMENEKYPDLALLNKILGGYFGSRLMKKIREEDGLTYGIYSVVRHYSEMSVLQILADVKKNNSEKAVDLVFAEIEQLQNDYIDEEELNLVKNYIKGEFASELNTAFDSASKFKQLLHHGLPTSFYNNFYNKIDCLKTDDVKDSARSYLQPDQFTVVRVV